jgi:protein-disulfide isomerase
MKRLRTRGPGGVLVLAALLLVVALAVGACTTPTPTSPTAAAAPAKAPATSAPASTEAAPKASGTSNLQAGVDANGNFYRGDPNAAVKLIEFSDFQ